MTGPSFLNDWEVAYPRRRGDWTLSDGGTTWGALDPERHRIGIVRADADPELPGLAGALRLGELASYRVGRRAVVRTPTSFVKVVRPRRLDALRQIHRALTGSRPGVTIPEVLGHDISGSVELSVVDGHSLHDRLRADESRSSLAATIDGIASALASFHSTRLAVDLPRHEPDDPWEWIDVVGRCEPDAVGELSRVARSLPPLAMSANALVHGDLHDKNIITTQTRVGLIDLDSAGRGAAEADVANLAVHLRLRALQAGADPRGACALGARLYAGYAASRPLDADQIRTVERHTWFRLACIYRFRRASRHVTRFMLRNAAPTLRWGDPRQ